MSSTVIRLGTPVQVGDVRIGVVTAILVDESGEHAFGLEVSARTGERWFLPSVAADVRGDAVEASSALVFGDRDQLDAYARRGARFIRDDDGGHSWPPRYVGEMAVHPAAERVLAGVPEGRPVS